MTKLEPQPTSQSDEALVEELAQTMGAMFQPMFARAMALAMGRDFARAILPIITAREASARAEGRREGIEEADAVRLALVQTQIMLEHIVETNSTCFSDVHDRIIANRVAIRALTEKQP